MKILKIFLFILGLSVLVSCVGGGNSEKAPTGKGVYKVGNPYVVSGTKYHPKADDTYDKTGLASWYGAQFHGRKTANGEIFNMNHLTAAHTTLPMPSFVKVTNLSNGRWLVLRVNDRGPFVGNRLIDVSRRSAQLLGFQDKGVTKVRIQAVPHPDAIPAANPTLTVKNKAALQKPILKIKPLFKRKITSPKRVVSDKKNYDIYIHVGNYPSKKKAEAVISDLSHLKKGLAYKTIKLMGKELFKVQFRGFKTMEKAEIILGRILSRGHNTAQIKKHINKNLKIKNL